MQFFQSLRLRKRPTNRRKAAATASARARLRVEELEDRITPTLLTTSLVAPYGLTGSAALLRDGSGNLYGTAANGGAYGDGTVFELANGASTLTALASFNGTDGANPHATLVMDGSGNLYGTTANGGSANDGTVFELAAGSSTITTLATFTGGNGANPEAGLVMDASGNLYGTTANGGSANDGTVFELPAGSSTITTLAAFNGSNGANPLAALFRDGSGNLYGTTNLGGAANVGTVFEVAAGSSTITTLAAFNGTNGANPQASLIMDGSGNLFSTAVNGGANSQGTIFEVVQGSGTISALASFSFNTSGENPQGSLVMDSSGNLYGTTANGSILRGAIRFGSVFELPAGSSSITTLTSFWGARGVHPLGLVMDGSGNLYGTTGQLTGNTLGTVFELAPASRTLTTLARFDHSNGTYPLAGVVLVSSGNLYGTAANGGAFNQGAVFERAAGSSTITALASFNGTNGAHPEGDMVIDSSGNLYGTTNAGGSAGQGTVFELAAGSGTITTLASFNGSNGSYPLGGLLMDQSGNLYGTTTGGGASSYGTVFEIVHGSGTITTLASFAGGYEADPIGNLLMDAQGNLYGTTRGNSSGYGAVFELAAGSYTLTTLAIFHARPDGSPDNGAYPEGGLVMDARGNLYGTTAIGGASGNGTIFEVVKGSGRAITLVSFNGTNGNFPQAGLVMDRNGNIYGTTFYGGTANDGVVFKLASGRHSLITLASFDGTDGAGPAAALLLDSSGDLFGTTTAGGSSNLGVVFEVTRG